tara:strand:- start:263 stop:916 length:654 start_codon:yes stop_codon:yes gene_type:complete
MIPKLIHKIFWDFSGENKPLNDFAIFNKCWNETSNFCTDNNIQLKLWNYQDCLQLLKTHYPKYLQLWEDFTQPVMKCDFIRYIILYHHGGIYMDMDVYPIQNFDDLLHNKQVFSKWNNDKRQLPYNALMMSEINNNLFLEIVEHSKISFYDKIKKPVYQTWTGRLVFQTTGHYMINRVIKKYKIKPMDILKINSKDNTIICGDNPYFEDFNASLWYA